MSAAKWLPVPDLTVDDWTAPGIPVPFSESDWRQKSEFGAIFGGVGRVRQTFDTAGESVLRVIEASRTLIGALVDPEENTGLRYEEATWRRAAEFVRRHVESIWETHGVLGQDPRILPGPDGSVDLHWETKSYELLINVPRDPGIPASFYGDDRGSIAIRGTLDPASLNPGVLMWLRRQG
jgi:hypothetical protein